ncbi:MAG TPA: outer membrane beta-barrel protein [Paenirhodobacter sp.]
MTNSKKALSVLLAIPVAVTTAFSAQAGGYTTPVVEAPVVAPAPAPVLVGDWQGAYIGATLGYAFAGDDRVALHYQGESTGKLGKFELGGVNGGIRAGYTWQRAQWVFGPEIAFEGGNVKDDFSNIVDDESVQGDTKLKNTYALRFKTGYLVNPVTMIYGIAGVSRAKFDYSVTTPFPEINIDDSFSRTGYVVGFGVERKLTDNLSLTGEYEYANYGKEHLKNAMGVETPATPKFSNVKIGLNYRF